MYNGKENEEELGLNWQAFGFRYYDNAVGRFTGVDPISDQFAWVSTYNYAENTPIGSVDLWGLQEVKFQTTLHDNNMRDATPQGRKISREASFKAAGVAGGIIVGGALVLEGGVWVLANPSTIAINSPNIGAFIWGLGTDEDVPGLVTDNVSKGLRHTGKKLLENSGSRKSFFNSTFEKFRNVALDKAAAATTKGGTAFPEVKKVINSNLPHAIDRAVERGIFSTKEEASAGLKNLTKEISSNGFPSGSILDYANANTVLVPTGENGLAVYQVAKNGTAKLKTTLIARE